MWLSPHELRVLRKIEQHLQQEDPELAALLTPESHYRRPSPPDPAEQDARTGEIWFWLIVVMTAVGIIGLAFFTAASDAPVTAGSPS